MIDDKVIKLTVIDRYDHGSGKYIDEEHDVHVCHIHVRYTNSKGEMVSMDLHADDFLRQYKLVKR